VPPATWRRSPPRYLHLLSENKFQFNDFGVIHIQNELFQLFPTFSLSLEHHKKWINEFNHRFSLFVIKVSFSQFLEHTEQKNGKSYSITLILIATNTSPSECFVCELKHWFLCSPHSRELWNTKETFSFHFNLLFLSPFFFPFHLIYSKFTSTLFTLFLENCKTLTIVNAQFSHVIQQNQSINQTNFLNIQKFFELEKILRHKRNIKQSLTVDIDT
jgi:hypothetical protein